MNKEQTQMIVLIVIVTVVLYAGTIMLLIKPGMKTRSDLKKKLNSLNQDVKKNKGIVAKKDQVASETSELSKKVDNYKKQFLSRSESEFFRETLRDMAGEYGVKIYRDMVSNLDDSKKSVFKDNLAFTEKQISLTLKGGYHDLGNFINRIENISIFRKIESFSISPDKVGGKLNIQMSILSLINENPT